MTAFRGDPDRRYCPPEDGKAAGKFFTFRWSLFLLKDPKDSKDCKDKEADHR
jgi:hypothetical protein